MKSDDPIISPPRAITTEELVNRFMHHAPDDVAAAQHGGIRAAALDFAEFVIGTVPAGREASTAITKIEEAMMWANAAIARNPRDKSYEGDHGR